MSLISEVAQLIYNDTHANMSQSYLCAEKILKNLTPLKLLRYIMTAPKEKVLDADQET